MSEAAAFLTLLTDQASRLFGNLIDRELLISVEAGRPPVALAEAVIQFGLADALTLAPEDGGLSFSGAATLFRLFGYHAAPLPIGEEMLARCVLARAGIEAPSGAIGLASEEPPSASVGFAPALTHLVLSRDRRLLLISTAGLGAEPRASISRQPRAAIDLKDVTPVAETVWPDRLPDALMLGAMLRSSQIAGAVRRLLDLSVEYANTRQQFGRPIGRFQAVQQLLAKLAAEAAAAQSAADVAWAALDAGRLGQAGVIAKIRAGEAARSAASIAHQVFGAIGVTDEHTLHYFTRRLWEWRLDFGSDGYWSEKLGLAAKTAEGGLWRFLTTDCGTPEPVEEPV